MPRCRRGAAPLDKGLEDTLGILCRYARPLVDANDAQDIVDDLGLQPDDPALRAEIDGVGKQVIECHQQLFAVECARDRRGIGKYAQLARLNRCV